MKVEKIHDFIHKEIQFEHQLISHRMNWYVTSQSFLMAAFAVSGSGMGSSANRFQGLFGWFIPTLGILISLIIWLSVLAADRSMERLKKAESKTVNALIGSDASDSSQSKEQENETNDALVERNLNGSKSQIQSSWFGDLLSDLNYLRKGEKSDLPQSESWQYLSDLWHSEQHERIHRLGLLPPRVIPALFIGSWMGLLVHYFLSPK